MAPLQIGLSASYELVRRRAEGITAGEIIRPTVTVRDGALLGIKLARRVVGSTERARFERLAAGGEFTLAHLTELAVYGEAVIYVRTQVERSAGASQATVPAEVITTGTGLRTRMAKVLAFYFDDATDVGRDLAKIRRASGYAELASGLITLGELYAAHRALIEKTPMHYLTSDEADATTTGHAILQHLTRDDADGRVWVDRQARVWTLFQTAYDEVCAAGRYLFRRDPDVDARFPSLHTLNYVAPKRDAEPEPTPTPVDG